MANRVSILTGTHFDRQSIVSSSATSFVTAPSPSDRSFSTSPLDMDHTHTQIHIVEVTRDTVHLRPPKPLPVIPREDSINTIGPPPPSPPASVDDSHHSLSATPIRISKSDPL